jgi:hypothetical protein
MWGKWSPGLSRVIVLRSLVTGSKAGESGDRGVATLGYGGASSTFQTRQQRESQ